MSVATKFPTTIAERTELGNELVRFPATWQEFVEIVEDCEYPIEYENQEIVAMSIASNIHELIVGSIITILNILFDDEPDIMVLGSNRHVVVKGLKGSFAPDAHVIKGEPDFYTLRKGLTANTNPWLIVEVLSSSTQSRDWNEKLGAYKKNPSCAHILYIKQDQPYVSAFHRKGDSTVWENIDYDEMEQEINIEGHSFSLAKLYKKVKFDEK